MAAATRVRCVPVGCTARAVQLAGPGGIAIARGGHSLTPIWAASGGRAAMDFPKRLSLE